MRQAIERARQASGWTATGRNGKRNRLSAQQTIPYDRIWKDGICQVQNRFSKTIRFEDISYQLANNDDKTAIFDGWCEFLNFFDSSIHFQFSFLNVTVGADELAHTISIPDQDDDFNAIRQEYGDMLQTQVTKGNNGLIKTKYITFGIDASTIQNAKSRLERIESSILGNFRNVGVKAKALNGKERLAFLHAIFHMNSKQKFDFEWNWLPISGLSTKDFIAPTSFDFSQNRRFQMDGKWCATSFLQVATPQLSDRLLATFLDMTSSQVVTIHVQPLDQAAAIKQVKSKVTALDQNTIEQQQRAVKSGYDMSILPTHLIANGEDMKQLLEDMMNSNEKLFLVTFLILHTANTKKQLETTVMEAVGIAEQHNCKLSRLDFQQEKGLVASLPLGHNDIRINRTLTTTATAGFVPFTTQELFQTDSDAIYYGLNALSGNMIMADRKRLKNGNGIILGTPGSGKSFSAKREILNVFLITNDDIAVLDPESEYAGLVKLLQGQVITISPLSTQYINPMDINLDNGETENPLILKSDFILSLFELMMGKVEADEKSIIDHCLQQVYMPYMEDPEHTPMPILEDLYNTIVDYGGEKAKHIADCMQIYVTGSLNVFNHRTNVDVHNRVVCYDTKELGNALKEFGMLVVQDQIWSRVSKNRDQRKSTRLYVDEMHLLLNKEQTANYTAEIWKRFRKWGGIPTGCTQNVKDFLSSRQVENIFENSDFIYLLSQASGDREILCKQLGISNQQASYVKNASEGEGLLVYGNIILPFEDHFPKDTTIYRILTTKVSDIHAMKEGTT